jgi:hypothetical protein
MIFHCKIMEGSYGVRSTPFCVIWARHYIGRLGRHVAPSNLLHSTKTFVFFKSSRSTGRVTKSNYPSCATFHVEFDLDSDIGLDLYAWHVFNEKMVSMMSGTRQTMVALGHFLNQPTVSTRDQLQRFLERDAKQFSQWMTSTKDVSDIDFDLSIHDELCGIFASKDVLVPDLP